MLLRLLPLSGQVPLQFYIFHLAVLKIQFIRLLKIQLIQLGTQISELLCALVLGVCRKPGVSMGLEFTCSYMGL